MAAAASAAALTTADAAAVAISMANFDVGTHRGCGCKGGAAATSRAANLCRGAYCLGTCAC
jgi:hypothetical protein